MERDHNLNKERQYMELLARQKVGLIILSGAIPALALYAISTGRIPAAICAPVAVALEVVSLSSLAKINQEERRKFF
jgi:hypothetical protein